MSDLIYNLGTLTPDRSRCAGDKPRYPKRISQGHGYAHGRRPKRRSASAPSPTSRMPGCIWTERYMSSVKQVAQPLKTTIPRRTITFGDNARIHLQANAPCTYVSGFIELIDTARPMADAVRHPGRRRRAGGHLRDRRDLLGLRLPRRRWAGYVVRPPPRRRAICRQALQRVFL